MVQVAPNPWEQQHPPTPRHRHRHRHPLPPGHLRARAPPPSLPPSLRCGSGPTGRRVPSPPTADPPAPRSSGRAGVGVRSRTLCACARPPLPGNLAPPPAGKARLFPPRQRSRAQRRRRQRRQGKEAGAEAGESGRRADGEPGAEAGWGGGNVVSFPRRLLFGSVWFSTRGGGGQESSRASNGVTEKERREPGHGHGHGRVATRQPGLESARRRDSPFPPGHGAGRDAAGS